jgi:hypothetical protein
MHSFARTISWSAAAAMIVLGAGAVAQPATQPAAQPDAQPAAKPEPKIEVTSRGGEDRTALRYAPAVGSAFVANMRMKSKVTQSFQGQQMPMDIPAMIFVVKTTVDKVEDGQIHYTMTFQEARSDVPNQDLTAMLDPIVGVSGKGVLTERGVSKSVDMDIPQGLAPQMEGQLESVKNSMGELAVALPAEPVGAGATWIVTTEIDQGGIKFEQVANFTLVGIKGGIAELKVTSTQSGDEQKIENDQMPAGVDITLKSLEGAGEGTTTVNLAWLVPVKATVANTVNMNMSVVSPQMSGDMGQSIEVNYSMEGKPAED